MHISWNFLDKRKAAMDAISVYHSMEFIIEHTEEDLMATETKMQGVGSPNMDGMPHSHNLHAMEDRILTGMERIKEMTDQYAMAREYMDWFTKAWNAQTEGDRYVLSRFYGGDEEYGSTAAADVAEHFDISTASAYRRKNRALSNLSLSLFGKHDVSDW